MKKILDKIVHKINAMLGRTIECEEPIHEWFGLTYASYLVIPRSVLQSIPKNKQKKLISILNEIEEIGYVCPLEGTYDVRVRDNKGRYIEDYYRDYERGRRKIFPKDDLTLWARKTMKKTWKLTLSEDSRQRVLFEEELNKTRRTK